MFPVQCPFCESTDVVKNGTSEVKERKNKKRGQHTRRKQRYLCQNSACHRTFHLEYTYTACNPRVKESIIPCVEIGQGIRGTSRFLKISTDTVISKLKKNKKEEIS